MTLTVPIVVDDVKELDDFLMSRCEYFTISSSSLSSGTTLRIEDSDGVILPLEVSGVLCRPVGASGVFETPEVIDATLAAFETEDGFAIESEYLWVPNQELIRAKQQLVGRGDVFRMNEFLFRSCLAFRHEHTPQQDFERQAAGTEIAYSETETRAFMEWNLRQIAEARSQHEEFRRSGQTLPWQDEEPDNGGKP